MTLPYGRAIMLYEQGHFERASSILAETIGSEPGNPAAHALLALSLARRHRLTEAAQAAEVATALAPDYAFCHYVRASIQHDCAHHSAAAESIAEAIRLDADDPDYHALQSQIRLDQGCWQAALRAADNGLRLNSSHRDCLNLRAMALYKINRSQRSPAPG